MGFIEEQNEKYKDFIPLTEPIFFIEKTTYSNGAVIYPGVTLGHNVLIGAGTIVYPNVCIYNDVYIANNCTIDSGAVIGASGFSPHLIDGVSISMKQVGGVRIGSDCEIGANTCIDRASLYGHDTIIGDRVLIDNLCHIAHNCIIEDDVQMAPQVCVGGSTRIGARTWVSIGVSIRQRLTIGKNCNLQMGAVVIADVPDETTVGGFYATDSEKWIAFSKKVMKGEL